MPSDLKTVLAGERKNRHRPRFRGLALMLILLVLPVLLAAPGAVARSQTKPAGKTSVIDMTRYETQLAAAINAARTRYGLRSLRLVPGLMRSAGKHSLQMAFKGYFAHSSPNGASFVTRVKSFYGGAASSYFSAGENLLWAQPRVTPRQVVKRWLASPEHRQVLL